MNAEILHSGFDGLKFTVMTNIPAELRAVLAAAKAEATKTNAEVYVRLGSRDLAVRRSGGMAFSAHTGEYGAEWYFLDPENRPANNPGVTVDFRAFLLATQGLDGAEAHFRECMDAFGIPYTENVLRVSRVDFAVDILAPWFAPDRGALVVPPGTRVREHTGVDETETHATGTRVTGLRAGSIANRQLVIYDKRQEVIQQHKLGWLPIWNEALKRMSLPPLDLADRDASQVWRFELRLGSKQLRNRWEMRSWDDVREKVGDAFTEFCERVRYASPTLDTNRSRWPAHRLWRIVEAIVSQSLHQHRLGVLPEAVKDANRAEHMLMLDRQILGLFVSRAAACGVVPEDFPQFVADHAGSILRLSDEHPRPIGERIYRAAGRYRFR
ncbi:MAG: hypothetical protein ACMVO5_00025 [Polymorphobacter sp.]|uniref:hypothetical protein n=1 Tax=Polymorphobacter sp. TaxID=1909290 RepID=UPI003A866B43